jgi:hypothetical protein
MIGMILSTVLLRSIYFVSAAEALDREQLVAEMARIMKISLTR